jgi:pimeloyl-ACP methyl ester carboxylesterase
MLDRQWVDWPARYDVTRVDLRGFGRSGRPTGSFSHAGDLLAVLDASGIERAGFVGASFGGLVALDLAASHPERVAALVLADAPLPHQVWSDAGADAGDTFLTEDLPSRLAALDIRTVVLTCEDDRADSQAIADRLASMLPHARRDVVAGASHLPSLEQPAAFDAVVLPFLDSVPAS